MASIITTTPDGVQVDLDSVPHTLTRNSAGFVTNDTIVYQGNTYVQTYTLDANNNVSHYSTFVKQ